MTKAESHYMAYEDLPTPIARHLRNLQYRRETQPVWHDEQTGTWHIYRYSDVSHVLADTKNFAGAPNSPSYSSVFGVISQPTATAAQRRAVVRNLDHVRPLLSEALTPRAVLRMQPFIERTAGELVDSLLPAGKMEVMSDLARPLATAVLAELIGLPLEDRERADASPAYFACLIGSAASEGHDSDSCPGSHRNLISILLSLEIGGERPTRDEVAASCYFFMTAARRALTDMLGNTMLLLSLQPDLLMRLRREPAPLYSTIEEALRYLPPVWTTQRTVIAPVALDGVNLPHGANVRAWIVAANHDPEQFDHPVHFDIDRIPNRHLTFGDGSKFSCLVGGLTRLVARLTVAAIAQRITALEVAPGDAVEVASPCEHGEPEDSQCLPEPGEQTLTPGDLPAVCSLTKLAIAFEARD